MNKKIDVNVGCSTFIVIVLALFVLFLIFKCSSREDLISEQFPELPALDSIIVEELSDLPDSAYWGMGPQEPPLLTGDELNESLYFWLMGNIINMKSDPPIPDGTSPYERIDTLYVEFDSVYWHGNLTVQETEELNRLIALYLDGLEK